MEWLGWMVAAVLLVLLFVQSRRRGASTGNGSDAGGGASSATDPGGPQPPAAPGTDPGPSRSAHEQAPSGQSTPHPEAPPSLEERELRALRGTLRYLRQRVVPALERVRPAVQGEAAAEASLEEALNAMEDLVFHAEPPPPETPVRENVGGVVQLAVRAYTIETRVPVRVHAPSAPLYRSVRPEALQDAVFLLLTNAGLFSGGEPVDVYVEPGDDPEGFRVRVADAGPGFSDEARERALEPFWSSDPQGLGLGLPQARARVQEMKGRLALRNREEGGAEVVVEVPGEAESG
jgi:signal transduction histidine kinase